MKVIWVKNKKKAYIILCSSSSTMLEPKRYCEESNLEISDDDSMEDVGAMNSVKQHQVLLWCCLMFTVYLYS